MICHMMCASGLLEDGQEEAHIRDGPRRRRFKELNQLFRKQVNSALHKRCLSRRPSLPQKPVNNGSSVLCYWAMLCTSFQGVLSSLGSLFWLHGGGLTRWLSRAALVDRLQPQQVLFPPGAV